MILILQMIPIPILILRTKRLSHANSFFPSAAFCPTVYKNFISVAGCCPCDWDVSSVTVMFKMSYDATSFNGDLLK